MVIMGLYNLGDVPFTDVFLHAKILDGKGQRMSKSKGNGIDPVDIIERYGADASATSVCEHADRHPGRAPEPVQVTKCSAFDAGRSRSSSRAAKHGKNRGRADRHASPSTRCTHSMGRSSTCSGR